MSNSHTPPPAELRAMLEKVLPGPVRLDPQPDVFRDGDEYEFCVETAEAPGSAHLIATFPTTVFPPNDVPPNHPAMHEAALYVALRNHAPALLGEVERASKARLLLMTVLDALRTAKPFLALDSELGAARLARQRVNAAEAEVVEWLR